MSQNPRSSRLRIVDDDDALLEGWQAGDDGAFEAIVDRHGSSLMGFLVRFLGDRPQAEDVWSESMLKVIAARDRIEPVGKLRSFLFLTARRTALDALRVRTRELRRSGPLYALDNLVSMRPGPDEHIERRSEALRLDEALARLPEVHRAALLMHYRYDLDTHEIGHALGLDASTVRDRLRYGRRLLRHMMAPALESNTG